MSRHVLYTRELEPITIIDLSIAMERILREQGRVTLHIPSKFVLTEDLAMPISDHQKRIDLTAESFRYRNVATVMLFVDDEEAALLLPASFLAGQTSALNNAKADAFARGFMRALELLQ